MKAMSKQKYSYWFLGEYKNGISPASSEGTYINSREKGLVLILTQTLRLLPEECLV